MRYTIALGGNIGNPQETFERAIKKLSEVISPVIESSSLYWTKPLVHPNVAVKQRAYLNAVVELDSERSPEEILKQLFYVECSLGRVRENEQIPWGPRTIDLDLIAAQDAVLSTESLTLPHPEMHKRDFVLLPMVEINPNWLHPILQETLPSLIQSLEEHWIIERIAAKSRIDSQRCL